MRRLVPLTVLIALVANAQGRFDKTLSNDQRIFHALNRLTFGSRPGDMEQVRSMGVDKWIALQLHPARITENPVLDAKLMPLESLRMDVAEILKEYPTNPLRFPQPQRLTELLTQEEYRKMMTGTAEERDTAIRGLDPQRRRKALAQLPPNVLAGLPEFQKEAESARKADQEERQKEIRRLMPQLNDLLNPDQMTMAYRGNTDQLKELFAYLDPTKRQQVAAVLPPQTLSAFPELRRQGMRLRQPQQVVFGDLKDGKLFRAVYSNRQLEEVLVDFWFNHFNVFEGKMSVRPLLIGYERDAIRPHVFGKFKDLLLATARHPAMLYYLDNWESVSPEAFTIGPFAEPVESMARQFSRRAHGLNENYGRELMELHTLGVQGGYTQQDVINVARCFTGWTIRQPETNPQFVYAGFMHDTGEKTVLGHKIAAGGGEQDGIQAIEILAHHPSTARFISRKLAQHFVADNPPQSLVDRMVQVFTKTDGDLRAVLESMFASPEFFSEGAWRAKIKSPFEMVVSAVRAVGADVSDPYALSQRVGELGEPLYGRQEPNGYSETPESWLNTAGILGRITFAAALTSGQISGVKVDSSSLDNKDLGSIAGDLLYGAPAQTLDAIQKGLEGKESTPRFIAGLVMGSPDFQKR